MKQPPAGSGFTKWDFDGHATSSNCAVTTIKGSANPYFYFHSLTQCLKNLQSIFEMKKNQTRSCNTEQLFYPELRIPRFFCIKFFFVFPEENFLNIATIASFSFTVFFFVVNEIMCMAV